MDAGAKGVKIQLAGRLGGAEMSRCEKAIAGSMPLSTLRAKIDYGFCEAPTAQGNIGIQVWVNQGMYEEDGDGADAQEGQAPKKPKRSYREVMPRAGNRVVFGDFGLQAEQPGWLAAATIEAGRIAAQQYLRTEGTALRARVPPQVDHVDPARNTNGQRQRRTRVSGGRHQAGCDPLRDRRRDGRSRSALLRPAAPTRCRCGCGS